MFAECVRHLVGDDGESSLHAAEVVAVAAAAGVDQLDAGEQTEFVAHLILELEAVLSSMAED